VAVTTPKEGTVWAGKSGDGLGAAQDFHGFVKAIEQIFIFEAVQKVFKGCAEIGGGGTAGEDMA